MAEHMPINDEALVEAVEARVENDLANIAYNRRWPAEHPNDYLMIAKTLIDNLLVALRSEGWDVYRPEDVATVRLCLVHIAEAIDDRTCDWYYDEPGSLCRVGTYRLVPKT